jgi:hypothetical protein
MSKNAPIFTAESIGALTDEQIIAWYDKHPNPTVRALVQRIAYNNEKHRGELLNSYQEGFVAALTPNPHGLTPEELRLGAAYVESYNEFD